MLAIKDLSFHYPGITRLFDGFNLSIAQGDLFGVVGPNGAGKSTLISLICGLTRPIAGSIFIDGHVVSGREKNILQKIAVVPQDYAFYPKLTGRENLAFFAHLYPGLSQPEQHISQVMELSGISGFADRRAYTYSGGMKRRLNLAIGLLNQPEFLILDEPTVGIDPQSRHFILQSIQHLNAQGTTILYTSHYMEEVERLCNKVAVVDQGKILLQGSLSDLLSNTNKLRLTLVKPVDANDAGIEAILKKYQLSYSKAELSGEVEDFNTCMTIITQLSEVGIKIKGMTWDRQSLESLFFELTNTALRER